MTWDRAAAALGSGSLGPDTACFLGTVRPDGRPHAAGIGVVVLDGAPHITSGPGSRKSRNLAADPASTLSLRLEGLDLVLEGRARRVTDPETLERAAAAYREGGWPAHVDGDALTAEYSAQVSPGRRRGSSSASTSRRRSASARAIRTGEPLALLTLPGKADPPQHTASRTCRDDAPGFCRFTMSRSRRRRIQNMKHRRSAVLACAGVAILLPAAAAQAATKTVDMGLARHRGRRRSSRPARRSTPSSRGRSRWRRVTRSASARPGSTISTWPRRAGLRCR